MKYIQVIVILFTNFCSCACLRISLCIEGVLSLFMNLCLSYILSWIICIECVVSFNIHHVFQCHCNNNYFFPDDRIHLFVCSYIRETKTHMEEEDRNMSRVVRTSIGTVT